MERVPVDNNDRPLNEIKIEKAIIHSNPFADYEGWNNFFILVFVILNQNDNNSWKKVLK